MKKYYLSLIIFGFTTTFAFSQTRNISTVRTHYPEVYNSIETSANRQWGGNPKIIQSVIEGQVDAFINILDLDNSENVALTDAIIKNSLPDTKEQNIRAIKNYSGTALFSKLKCDWYKVQLDYQKNNNTVPSPSFSTKTTPPVIKSVNTVKENDSSFAVEFSEPIQETKTGTPPNPTPIRNSGNSQKETSYYRKEAVGHDTYNNKASNTPTSSNNYNQSKPPVRKDAKPPVKGSAPVENNAENTATDENLMIWF